MDDQGTYTCTYPSQRVNSTCKVHVAELPLAIVQGLNEEYTVTENDDITLSVELNKMTPLKYEWLKDGVPLETNDNVRMLVQGERYYVKLLDAKVEDQGKYTFCITETNIETSTNLKVNEIPIYFTRPLKEEITIMENTADYRFDCEINKEKKIAKWFKDDSQEPLTSNDEFKVQVQGRVHSIVFQSVKLQHAGKYTCQFSDDVKSIGTMQVDGKEINRIFYKIIIVFV